MKKTATYADLASLLDSVDERTASAVRRLTFNGAMNLRGTIDHPHERFPDLLNGGIRLYTGSGKWTSIAARGVISHLAALGLIEDRFLDWNGGRDSWERPCLTPLGRQVAQYITDNWDHLDVEFR